VVVKEYELNLSATEFVYFLECPQKFRLYRMLNPVPDKEDFMENRRTNSSYKLRGYKGSKDKGIGYHLFFETFHKEYAKVITEKIPPVEIQEDNVKLLYWVIQQEKYLEAKKLYYWYPFATELRLMTEKQRGIIDCLELCETKNGLRLLDYKPTPEPNDELTLLFYANLLNDYRLENVEDERFDYKVIEIGNYYYQMGVSEIYNLTEMKNSVFNKTFSNMLEEITNENFYPNKSSCWNCNFRIICKIEPSKYREY